MSARGRAFQPLFEKQFFEHEQDGEIHAPGDKVPCSAVPQSGCRPNDGNVEDPASGGHAIAAEGDVQIVAEPAAERHMPPAPELGDAAGDERIIEVLEKVEAEYMTEPDCHVAVTREIKVNVQGIGDGIEPVEQHGLVIRILEDVHELAEHIGKQDLFGETDDKAADAECGFGGAVRAGLELSGNICVAHDRTCDQLREHGDVGGEVDVVALRRHIAAIDVDDIADDLEGIEADADRQRDLQKRDRQPGDGIEAGDEEVSVFAIAEHGKAEHNGERQEQLCKPFAAVFLNQPAEDITLRDGDQHQDEIFRLTPAVEKQTGKQKYAVLQFSRCDGVKQQYARQEIIKKRYT